MVLAACPAPYVNTFTPANWVVAGVRKHMATPLHTRPRPPQPWFLQVAATDEEIKAEVSSMRAGEIKKELESYGISTVSFLEKSELVDALVDARAKGLEPKEKKEPSSSTTASTTTSYEDSSSRPREVRLQEEIKNLANVKASDMKKELEERGISTASFFEKSEFLKALAAARVDGVFKNNDGNSGSKKKKRRGDNNSGEEGYAEYANVEVITDDNAGPRKKRGQPSAEAGGGGSPFGGTAGGSSPFGGGAGMGLEDILGGMGGGGGGMPGGMGGMGGIADLLKNMGGMGGAAGGSSPFGGMGGMGGMGDMMGKAQEMMKNPKVMELMMKAQSNPKMMAVMQECMSNPAAIAKYRNDPEVSELIRELEKYI